MTTLHYHHHYHLLHLASLLLLLMLPSNIHAFVPPKPGTDLAATYEPVHLYRQRHNISYGYHPTALHPETCRYLTEEACQDADESMHRHQQRHRALQRKLGQERIRRNRRLQQEEENSSSNNNLRGDNTMKVDDSSLLDGLTEEEEELQYHMAEFRKILGELTTHMNEYTGLWDAPTTKEERQELEEFLRLHGEDEEEDQQHTNTSSTSTAERHLQPQQAASTGRNPRVGTFRVLVLLLKFSDHKSRKTPNRYEYQILWNLRIRRWLIANSYGNYDAFFDVRPWRDSDKSEKHYSFGQSGRVAEFQESYWPLLNALDNDPNHDWTKYDVDGNGLLDNLIVLHSGYAAEEGGQDCTNGREYLDRIWSHAFSDSNGWRNSAGTYGVEGYMIASGLDLTCDSNPAKMGVMTHEYMHTFYLIDLYDYTFEGKGVGNFDIMAYPYGFGNDGYLPVSMSVWAKTAVDWLTCQDITTSGTYTLEPAATSASCLKILLQADDEGNEEYFLVENRQKLGFDVDFWESGIVLYHIDEAANEQFDRGFPGQGGWPGNGKHYEVAVLQADGEYDLEKGNNIGDAGDLYLPGMSIGPNWNGNTYPNTDMYMAGNVKKSFISIDIGDQQGKNIPVTVNFQRRSGDEEELDKPPPEDSAFSTPNKEAATEEAEEQFRTPDAEEYRISGKIPQLPWREEALQQQQAEGGVQIFESDVLAGPLSGALSSTFGTMVAVTAAMAMAALLTF